MVCGYGGTIGPLRVIPGPPAESVALTRSIRGYIWLERSCSRAWNGRYYLALSALRLRHSEDAYNELNAVVELRPSFSAARLKLAELLLLSKKTSEAREQANAVLADGRPCYNCA